MLVSALPSLAMPLGHLYICTNVQCACQPRHLHRAGGPLSALHLRAYQGIFLTPMSGPAPGLLGSLAPGLQGDVCAQHLSPHGLALAGCQALSLLHPAALPVLAERALLASAFTHLLLYLSLPITSRSGLSLVCSAGGFPWLLCSLSWVWGFLFSATLSRLCFIVS